MALFLIGFACGGFLGIFFMALLFISKREEEDMQTFTDNNDAVPEILCSGD